MSEQPQSRTGNAWPMIGRTLLALILMPVAVTMLTALAALLFSPFDGPLVALWTLVLGWTVAFALAFIIVLPGHLILQALNIQRKGAYFLLGLFPALVFYIAAIFHDDTPNPGIAIAMLAVFPIGAIGGVLFWWLAIPSALRKADANRI